MINVADFDRKVKEKYGQSRPYVVLASFAVTDPVDGGDGVCAIIEFENGHVSGWLSVEGLWYESDRVEINGYVNGVTDLSVEALAAVARLNDTKSDEIVEREERSRIIG